MPTRGKKTVVSRIALGISAILLGSGLVAVADVTPAMAAQEPTTCEETVSLRNTSFEQPSVPKNSYQIFTEADVPGWDTTDSRNAIEIWNRFGGIPAGDGDQFAELNAYSAGTLSQDVKTVPGQKLTWRLKHRGRQGKDTMRVIVGPPGGPYLQSGKDITDDKDAWGTHYGTYTVPEGQTVTHFGFQAVSAAGGNAAIGNFLDDITFGTDPCLIGDKTVKNLSRESGQAQVGDLLEYRFTARNDGGNPGYNTVSTDQLQPGQDFVPGSLRILSGGGNGPVTDAVDPDRGEYLSDSRTVRVRLGEDADGIDGGLVQVRAEASYSFQVRVNIDAAGSSVKNEAQVTYENLQNEPKASQTQTTETPVAPVADLSVVKTRDTDPIVAGRPVAYTVKATNAGPQIGNNVTVIDALPSGISEVTADSDLGECSVADGKVTCTFSQLQVDQTATITINGTVSPSLDPGSAFSNTASISGDETDPNSANNTSQAEGTVTTSADIAVLKTFTPETPTVGGTVTYNVTATNTGPSDAREVTITDPLAPMLTFVSADDPCVHNDQNVLCELGTLTPGASVTKKVTVQLPGDDPDAAIENSVSITSATSDPDPDNNADSVSFDPKVVSDLSLTKTADKTKVSAGDLVTYTVAVQNPSDTQLPNTEMVDQLPRGMTVQTLTTSGEGVCTTQVDSTSGNSVVRCVWDRFPVGSETVTIAALVAADAPAGVLTNTATVVAPIEDPDPGNNSGSVDVTVEQSADIGIVKVGDPGTGVPGTEQRFTMTARNAGPSLARGVSIIDPIPVGYTNVTADHEDCKITAGVLRCAIGDLAPGGTVTVTLTGTIAATQTGALSNSATASSATPDPNPDDNTSTATVPLQPSAG